MGRELASYLMGETGILLLHFKLEPSGWRGEGRARCSLRSSCHGAAGTGYAFLKLYVRTGDDRWLDRARRLAMHAIAQNKSALAK